MVHDGGNMQASQIGRQRHPAVALLSVTPSIGLRRNADPATHGIRSTEGLHDPRFDIGAEDQLGQ